MSARIEASVAQSHGDIADCQRVRHRVFVVEKGLVSHDTTKLDREVESDDYLDTTIHIIVRAEREPIATVRLLRPSAGVRVGLDARYDLTPLAIPGVSLAEGSRLCVVPEHRGGAVFGVTCAAMIHEGLRAGLTHLVIAANAETDSIEDAMIAYRIAAREGFTSDRFRVFPRRGASAPAPSVHGLYHGLYTADERARARAGDLEGLRLPRALSIFAERLGARYMGPPIRERDYSVCSVPAVIDLADAARVQAIRRARP